MFGEEPIPVWRDKEWMTLIEMVVSGIELAHTDWEKVRYCSDTWSDADNKRTSAPNMHKNNLVLLKKLAENPDIYNAHLKDQPAFEAAEVDSAPTKTAKHIEHEAAFDSQTKQLWTTAAEAARPKIAAEAMKAKTARGTRAGIQKRKMQ